MIVFEGVSKRFEGSRSVLDGVGLAVPRGSFCVLLGASGAGKSTLLRMVNGLLAPDAGTVRVDGVAVERASLNSLRPRIGMVHQHFNLTPRLNVATNILAGGLPVLPAWRSALGLFPPAMKDRAVELLHAVGLDEAMLGRRAERLSGGQQQRVGIARAFLLDPLVLLADEPVASLDPALSVQILMLLREQAARTGATVLCSLHQVELARRFADRIVGLKHGRVLFDAAPEALADDRVAALYDGVHGRDRADG